MPNPQFITTPGGHELVVIPRAEYEALLAAAAEAEEDAADAAVYDRRKAELAARTSACLPNEVSDAMLRGASLLTALRKWRGFRQTELAEKAGLSQSYLSALEAGQRQGTAETLAAIARVLDIPMQWLE